MPRASAKSKKKPLRASVRQQSAPVEEAPPWLTFGMRLTLLVVGAFIIILFAAWLWHSDWPRRQSRALTQGVFDMTRDAHFAVKDVAVEGRVHTDKDALYAALGVNAHDPILQIDTEAALGRVLTLPWVEKATIERQLPDKIFIRLTERQPIARWQNDGKTSIIDHEGKVLTDADAGPFANLPLLAGAGAPEAADKFLKDIGGVPDVKRLMKGAVRVGERRWDLYLQPSLIVRLPEKDQREALQQLAGLLTQDKVLDKNIASIDLRVAGKIALQKNEPPPAPKKENGVSPK